MFYGYKKYGDKGSNWMEKGIRISQLATKIFFLAFNISIGIIYIYGKTPNPSDFALVNLGLITSLFICLLLFSQIVKVLLDVLTLIVSFIKKKCGSNQIKIENA